MSDTTTVNPPVDSPSPAHDTIVQRIDTASIIAIMIVTAAVALLFALIFKDKIESDVFKISLGTFFGSGFGGVAGFFFGSSKGSAAKDETINALVKNP